MLPELTLRAVVERIEDFDAELTIYAMPDWMPYSSALVASDPGGGVLPRDVEASGMTYFLEVAIAVEVLDALTNPRKTG